MTSTPDYEAIGNDAPEGDRLEQLTDAGPGADPTGSADVGLRMDANEVDVHEQSMSVPLDEDDY